MTKRLWAIVVFLIPLMAFAQLTPKVPPAGTNISQQVCWDDPSGNGRHVDFETCIAAYDNPSHGWNGVGSTQYICGSPPTQVTENLYFQTGTWSCVTGAQGSQCEWSPSYHEGYPCPGTGETILTTTLSYSFNYTGAGPPVCPSNSQPNSNDPTGSTCYCQDIQIYGKTVHNHYSPSWATCLPTWDDADDITLPDLY